MTTLSKPHTTLQERYICLLNLPAFVVTMVLDSAYSTIRLVQGVFALNDVTVAVLMLGLDVVGVGVLYFISELVFGVRLEELISCYV